MKSDRLRPLVAFVLVTMLCAIVLVEGMRAGTALTVGGRRANPSAFGSPPVSSAALGSVLTAKAPPVPLVTQVAQTVASVEHRPSRSGPSVAGTHVSPSSGGSGPVGGTTTSARPSAASHVSIATRTPVTTVRGPRAVRAHVAKHGRSHGRPHPRTRLPRTVVSPAAQNTSPRNGHGTGQGDPADHGHHGRGHQDAG